jgi:hypothetical protein
MFILSLRVHNDSKYEYALVAECEMKQMLLVSTKTSGGGSTTAGASSTPSANASPSTVPSTDTGNVQTTQSSFNSLQSGTGPTQIPTGGGSVSDIQPTTDAAPIATPNSNGGASGETVDPFTTGF